MACLHRSSSRLDLNRRRQPESLGSTPPKAGHPRASRKPRPVQPPKSESGRRTIAGDATTLAAVKSHRARQNGEKLALGAGYADDDLVFAREDGAALRPEWVSKRFHLLTDAAKLPRIHLHDLRHSAASMALTAGVPMKVVSENLGHASLRITADVYSHVTTDLAKESAERVAAALAANAM